MPASTSVADLSDVHEPREARRVFAALREKLLLPTAASLG